MLDSLSVLDGRYANKTKQLAPIFSEAGLISQRVRVEVVLLECLSEFGVIRNLAEKELVYLNQLSSDRKLIEKVKKIEQITRHDVKAVELAIKEKMTGSLQDLKEMIHFAVTSEDINNLAYRLQFKQGLSLLYQAYVDLGQKITELSEQYAKQPLLARTHGQSAIPTTLGKELAVYALRLDRQLTVLDSIDLCGKVNGAVGCYNSFHFFAPEKDWLAYSELVTKKLGLKTNYLTTQINTYEDVVEKLQAIQRINLIVLDFDQDMWRYISDDLFTQAVKPGEVGSSVMSHKVNPIDFEGSEGNLQIANSLIEGLTRKLMISRLQRDLSDSTSIRNLGAVVAYSMIAASGTLVGLNRVTANQELMTEAVNYNYAVLAEAVQTILRASEDVEDPYQITASSTKGRQLTEKDYLQWIEELEIDQEVKDKLINLKPEQYTGLSEKLVGHALSELHHF
jgi:adenylosuccinate lyase